MKDDRLHLAHLTKTVEGIWQVCCQALGEDHLLTQAFETALRSGDMEMMHRSIGLLANSPEALKKRVFWGEYPLDGFTLQ